MTKTEYAAALTALAATGLAGELFDKRAWIAFFFIAGLIILRRLEDTSRP